MFLSQPVICPICKCELPLAAMFVLVTVCRTLMIFYCVVICRLREYVHCVHMIFTMFINMSCVRPHAEL